MAGAVSLGLLATLAWQSGGYFPDAYLGAGSVAFAALAVILLVRPPHWALSTPALLALAGLGGLAAWTALSATWSPAPSAAMEDVQRDLLYLALFALGVIAAGTGRLARHLVWLVLALIVLIVGAGLLARLFPTLVADTTPFTPQGGYRLAYPLGYWNAFGALAAMGGVLALGLAGDPRSAVPLRGVAGGAAVLCTTAMYLSFSRGSWLALFVGLLALVALGAHRGSLLASAGIAATATAVAIGTVHSLPALTEDPDRAAGQVAAGHTFAGTLLLLVLAAVTTQAAIAHVQRNPRLMKAIGGVFRPILLVVAGLVVLGAAGLYAAKTGPVERHSAGKLYSGTNWIDRQWDDFMHPATFAKGGDARLTSAKGTRSDLYRVALDGFAADPLRGDGAGGFEARFARERRVDEKVRDAHSLYFETLDELGLPGIAFLLLVIVAIAAAAIRSRLRPGGLPRAQVAAVSAACCVWVVHAGVDWDWQVPALTGIALVLAATLFPVGRRRMRRSQRRRRVAHERNSAGTLRPMPAGLVGGLDAPGTGGSNTTTAGRGA